MPGFFQQTGQAIGGIVDQKNTKKRRNRAFQFLDTEAEKMADNPEYSKAEFMASAIRQGIHDVPEIKAYYDNVMTEREKNRPKKEVAELQKGIALGVDKSPTQIASEEDAARTPMTPEGNAALENQMSLEQAQEGDRAGTGRRDMTAVEQQKKLSGLSPDALALGAPMAKRIDTAAAAEQKQTSVAQVKVIADKVAQDPKSTVMDFMREAGALGLDKDALAQAKEGFKKKLMSMWDGMKASEWIAMQRLFLAQNEAAKKQERYDEGVERDKQEKSEDQYETLTDYIQHVTEKLGDPRVINKGQLEMQLDGAKAALAATKKQITLMNKNLMEPGQTKEFGPGVVGGQDVAIGDTQYDPASDQPEQGQRGNRLDQTKGTPPGPDDPELLKSITGQLQAKYRGEGVPADKMVTLVGQALEGLRQKGYLQLATKGK